MFKGEWVGRILSVIDRLSKTPTFTAVSSEITAEGTAEVVYERVVCEHGMPYLMYLSVQNEVCDERQFEGVVGEGAYRRRAEAERGCRLQAAGKCRPDTSSGQATGSRRGGVAAWRRYE
uniref:Uncharacterized protein n=1 Tax=Chromera velia CCMP2878 TaxID=1169474 RepID=A0A0G4I1N5_9ALVE|eukprot:Cvel_1672.t1-p1 / transcript=Cvel_1672.t1 / gene=Cvel_1672 / organism=Chromera_velia_CCMP2878 / gene_product=hypothetical protein / transcript_product=hypothetical protein / location=Cvel_scaffold60:43940-45345(+) / protein_length=118 / sequence_SO=supercontig / SO=protein_coding / is_pseudo=false